MAKHKYIETPEKMKSNLIKKIIKQKKESIYLIYEFGCVYFQMIKALPKNVDIKDIKMFTKYTR